MRHCDKIADISLIRAYKSEKKPPRKMRGGLDLFFQATGNQKN
jgi:hypothetical protein